MKRIIKDYANLNADLRELLDQAFPNGINKRDLISFPTNNGKRLYGVELDHADVRYLIRISSEELLGERGFRLIGHVEDDLVQGSTSIREEEE